MLVAAALSLWGSVQYWDAETAYQRQSPDPYGLAGQAARLADFQAAVPADAILGYLTDVPPEDPRASSMFFAAQFALAPRILRQTDAADLVLGNFTRPGDFAAAGRQHGLQLQRDFGNGIVLFRREAHP